ncbi:MAG: cell division FtsA domain-containing protein [Syntrophomonadaceae bacterium]|jgi:cell division protein FtsA
MDQQTIYALDIGTRKIVGLVMQRQEDCFTVIGSEMIEHSTRAMMDGQIHEVDAVAGTIRKITAILEERLQIPLQAAAVAAAGRALQTSAGKAAAKRSLLNEISLEEVLALEIEAVQQARIALLQDQTHQTGSSQYYCAGYSVTYYRLEDQHINNLVGQVGSFIETEVIATFLPRVVVDSLFSALKRSGLELLSLTLEPIAALSVAVPPGLRLLNLALVDIGAGTSDIAIVKEGKISAYAMVPMGGDELTETLASRYLLDFHHAEKIKRQLADQDAIELEDILKNTFTIESLELQKSLQPMINDISARIAGHILNLNQKPPDAVICIGGGSLTPSLIAALADQLELPRNRVGTRTAEGFDAIHCEQPYLQGPQGVTPLGIAYHAFLYPPVPFVNVGLNEANLRLWNIGELTVGNALLGSGISLASIYGRPGLGKTITVNGKMRVFPGKGGTAPVIRVNGQAATLDSRLSSGDSIEFIPGSNGEDARVMVSDLFNTEGGQVWVNEKRLDIKPFISVNGQEVDAHFSIPDRARIDYQEANSLAYICLQAGVPEHMLTARVYHYVLNNEEKDIEWLPIKITVNGRSAGIQERVPWESEVTYHLLSPHPTLQQILGHTALARLRVYVNNEEIVIKVQGAGIMMDGRPVAITQELVEGCRITLDKTYSNAILSDIFQVYELKPYPDRRLILKVNGAEAGFTTPIHADCRIEVYWEE